MSVLEMSGVIEGALTGAELSLDAGVHAVLGAATDGTGELVAIASGMRRPRRGQVRVAGRDPRTNPDTRRHIASLLAEERLIPAPTVAGSVARALKLLGQQATAASDVLTLAGLGSWAERRPDALDAGERRSVALAIALAERQVSLAVLYEPLSDVPGIARQVVLDAVGRLAESGACVLCATASARDAGELSSSLLLLDRGRFVRRPPPPLSVELAPGTAADFLVQSDDPRRLAAELARDDTVAGIEWNEQQSPSEIRVRGADAARVALAISRTAVTHSIRVHAISATLPDMDVVRGASDGLARAAYERATWLAQSRAREAFRVAPRTGAAAAPLYGAPHSRSPEDGKPPEGGAA